MAGRSAFYRWLRRCHFRSPKPTTPDEKRLLLFFEVTTQRRPSCFGKTTPTGRRSGARTTLFCVHVQNSCFDRPPEHPANLQQSTGHSHVLITLTPAAAPLTPDTYAPLPPMIMPFLNSTCNAPPSTHSLGTVQNSDSTGRRDGRYPSFATRVPVGLKTCRWVKTCR